jgi:hypothetical protein
MWALRHNLSAYDATHVALTEMTAATSLLTTDARLAIAPGIRCTVRFLQEPRADPRRAFRSRTLNGMDPPAGGCQR